MAFEDILKNAGDCGRYQKTIVVCFLIPCFTVFPWFSMHVIFLTYIPDHWCYVHEIVNSSLPLAIQKKLIRPMSDPKCSMYAVDYSHILHTRKSNLGPDTPTKPCDNGWQFDKTDYDATSVTRWNMVCKDDHYVPFILSCTFIGVFLGTPFFALLSECIGRKPSFFITATVIAVTDVGSTLVPNFTLFILFRILQGSAVSTIYTNAYILILDIVNPKMRMRLNGISTVSWTVGMGLVPLLAWLTRDWVKLCAINSSCAAGLLLYWKYIPESPSWLISRGRYEKVTRIVTKISKFNGGTAHEDRHLLESIRSLGAAYQLRVEDVKNVSTLNLIIHSNLRKRFLLVVVCWMCNSMPYFGLQMNTRFLAGNQFLNFFLASIVEVPALFATWIVVELFGRRWCAVSACLVTSASCVLPFFFQGYEWVPIIVTFIAKASTNSAYITLYIQGPELFPASLRVRGIGLLSTAGAGGAIVTPFIVYLNKYGDFLPFVVFATIMVIAAFCASFLPETLNKTLPETVSEAEEFEKDWNYFSCVGCPGVDEETSERNEMLPLSNSSDSEKQNTSKTTTKKQ